MKLTLPFGNRLSETSMIGVIFASIFIVGLGVFSLSASVIVSSAFLGVTSLAAYAVARQRSEKVSGIDPAFGEMIDTLSRRVQYVEGSLKTVDARILASGTTALDQIRKEMAPLMETMNSIADLLEQERLSGTFAAEKQLERPNQNVASGAVNAIPSSANPLLHLRAEAMLRDALLGGNLIITTCDIVALPTARPAYRMINAHVAGYSEGRMEAALRSENFSANLIRLFDKVRFAHAFELASHLALTGDSPIIICPLTLETLDDPTAGNEISGLLARSPGIAKRLCFLLNEDLLFLDIGYAGMAMRNIVQAGSTFAAEIERSIGVEPASLQNRGVTLAIVPPDLILATRDGKLPTDIHPADLVQLFGRHGIDLAVSTPTTESSLRAARSLGINLVMRPKTSGEPVQKVRMRPEPVSVANRLPRAKGLDQLTKDVAPAEPLRAHLRRISA